jgi:hypothetical protein
MDNLLTVWAIRSLSVEDSAPRWSAQVVCAATGRTHTSVPLKLAESVRAFWWLSFVTRSCHVGLSVFTCRYWNTSVNKLPPISGSQDDEYEDGCLLGWSAISPVDTGRRHVRATSKIPEYSHVKELRVRLSAFGPVSLLFKQSKVRPCLRVSCSLISFELDDWCEISSPHGGEYDVQSCLLGYTAV